MVKNDSERRKFIRVPKEFVVSASELVMSENAPEQVEAKLVNISVCGILFESKKSFPEGTILKLKLQIQRWEKYSSEFKKFDQTSVSKPFVGIGTVVRCELSEGSDSFFMGVSLDNVDETHSQALKRYLDHIIDGSNVNGNPVNE